MSDSAVATIVAGIITVVTMVIGFLTLWVKLKYAGSKAEEAADKAVIVEKKIDDNTATTKSVDAKTDTIVGQTNGVLTQMRALIDNISERVSKMEDYNRESSHRLFDVINVLALKVERLLVAQENKTPTKEVK